MSEALYGYPYPQALPGPPAYLKVVLSDDKGPVIGQSLGEFPHGLRLLRTTLEIVMFIPWTQIWAVYVVDTLEQLAPEGVEK